MEETPKSQEILDLEEQISGMEEMIDELKDRVRLLEDDNKGLKEKCDSMIDVYRDFIRDFNSVL